jgi:hypothetical protein
LTASTLVVEDNAADDLAVLTSGNFTFATALAGGNSYTVTVKTQPAAQYCSVTNGTGTIASADVTNVAITCVGPPERPVASVSYGIKQVILSWPAVAGATRYKVARTPDGTAPYSTLADNLTTTRYTDVVAVHLIDWINGRYRVSACNPAGCADSAPIAALSTAAIGYLKASNTSSGQSFGWSVALSGDGATMAVGARYEGSTARGINGNQNDGTAPGSGAVYVFTRTGNDWSQQAYVKASNTATNAQFGTAVALPKDGNTLVVGSPHENSGATGIGGDQSLFTAKASGAVYVFQRSGGVWSQQAYVKASNTDAGDAFGTALSLSKDGDMLAVGAPHESSNARGIDGDQSNNAALSSGAVYVFGRTAGIWSQQAYVKASNTDPDDDFGHALALSGDGNTLAVGADYEASSAQGIDGDQSDNSSAHSGAVYVFARKRFIEGLFWVQQAYMKPPMTFAINYSFGSSVALADDGNRLVVGAPFPRGGAVDIFERTGSVWLRQIELSGVNTESYDSFGWSVALSGVGDLLVVCAPGERGSASGIGGDQNDNRAPGSGAVYAFAAAGGTWSQSAYVKASNTDAGDQFGSGVALSGDGTILAVGADYESGNAVGIGGDQSNNSLAYAGALYLY